MAKHTAGPWEWRTNAGRVYLRTVNRGGLYIMDFVRKGMQGAQPRFAVWKGEEREKLGGVMHGADEIDIRLHPDARLIAAAPDLLASLIEMRDLFDLMCGLGFNPAEGREGSPKANADAAIAKATGVSHG
ncbi:hypothetical protein [Dyella amyloliquefaciens]|uniref:hypothetical protein n=1 Tax=Dyella amyloliquefaciens TaxID=1770545 RepID=UPI00102E57F9|nr:hypothetical protein [Dyella amyloliquefaciens]